MSEKNKKVLIIVGTRPNFIKVTQFEKELAKHGEHFDYKLLHTGQHYDENMSKVFFDQLELKEPDYYLDITERVPSKQIASIIIKLDEVMSELNPDLVMVVGDVSSTMAAAIAANKAGLKVAHLESGLRSFDRTMPEEINRIVADAVADMFFVTEVSGENNLLKDGKNKDSIHFVGNTMIDTLVAFDNEIKESKILEELSISKDQYALMTMHRPANVDSKEGLEQLWKIIELITQEENLVFPIHPRTRMRMTEHGMEDKIQGNERLLLCEPLDYLSFQKLILECKYVITDSGGIQEETTFRKKPCLTLRDNTERPSTITLGTNQLLEFTTPAVQEAVAAIRNGNTKQGQVPPLWDGKTTERIVGILKEVL